MGRFFCFKSKNKMPKRSYQNKFEKKVKKCLMSKLNNKK